MPIPDNVKDQVIYHTILAEMHHLQGIMLNLRSLDAPETEKALREHFTREQTMALGKLAEWRKHRPEIYRQAEEDFRATGHPS